MRGVHVDPARAAALSLVQNLPTHALLAGGDPILGAAVRAAQGRGHGIVLVGCDPADVRVDGDGWSAEAVVALEGDPVRRRVAMTGVMAPAPRVDAARLVAR